MRFGAGHGPVGERSDRINIGDSVGKKHQGHGSANRDFGLVRVPESLHQLSASPAVGGDVTSAEL